MVSPSIVGLVAKTTSLTSGEETRFNKESILISLIPIPFVGDKEPFSI